MCAKIGLIFSRFTRTQVAAHTYTKLVVQIVYSEAFYMYYPQNTLMHINPFAIKV